MNKKIRITVFILFFSMLSLIFLNAEPDLPFLDTEPKISMDFQDANLKDVLKVLSIQSGLNFIASESVQDRKITLYFDNVPLDKAMDKIFKANNLSYDLDKNSSIFIVKDWGKSGIETITKVFYLKYATVSSSSLKEEMADKLKPSEGEGESTSSSGVSTSSSSEDKGKWKIEEDTGITIAVKKLLSETGSVIEDFRTNSLIVTDTPARLAVISQVIASLDVPVPQIMLEVEMLDVSKNAVDKMGVQWANPLASLNVVGKRETSFPFGSQGTDGSERSITPASTLFGSGISDTAPWAASHFAPSMLTVIGQTLQFNFLKTLADTKILARPRIRTLNNETAEIKITTQEAIGTITETFGEGGAATASVSAERVETGVSLRVTPQINLDADEVTLFISPSVKDATTSTFNANFKDPEERSAKATLRVKDGETVVIGGLIRNDKSNTDTNVPILSKIPLFGGLFRHKYTDKNKERELLVFITPHIIKDNEVKLAKKQESLPVREQNTISGLNRQGEINSSLNSFDKEQ